MYTQSNILSHTQLDLKGHIYFVSHSRSLTMFIILLILIWWRQGEHKKRDWVEKSGEKI